MAGLKLEYSLKTVSFFSGHTIRKTHQYQKSDNPHQW